MLITDPTPDSLREAEDNATETPAPKKRRRRRLDASSVGVLALFVLAGAGLWYMHWRTRDSVEVINSADAKTAKLNTLLESSKKTLATLSTSMSKAKETVAIVSGRDTFQLASFRPLDRDPFAFQPPVVNQSAEAAIDTNHAAREEAREKALAAARTLQLQSIMYGSARRSCLIDGKLFFENARLNDFTIAKITPESVLLKTGEFTFELKLRK